MRPMRYAAILLASVIAAAPAGDDPDALIRRANAAFAAGDVDAAESLYSDAEERTGDPGLIAFNKAAVLFARHDYYGAEVHYARSLDDAACPADRAIRAWFNRGSCLLRRGGSAEVYRSAVACFEKCLALKPDDAPLAADARRGLELAKLLWAEENRRAAKPQTPNAPPPEEFPEPPPSALDGMEPGTPEPGMSNTGPNGMRPSTAPEPIAKTGTSPDSAKAAGNNPQLQPLKDANQVAPLSPEETRRYLQQTEERLRRERQGMLRTIYGPDRPGVKDW